MRKKLLVSGCSFTDINYVQKINSTGGKQCPEFPTWSEILAKKFAKKYGFCKVKTYK